MKYIILFFILNFNLKESPKNTPIINQEMSIIIVDESTNETLVGVKNNNNYSDLDGILKINKGDSINLELISYEKLIISSIKNDTIIKMSKID
jgi:hypothetical protein